MGATTEGNLVVGVTGRGADKVDGPTQGAGAVGKRIGTPGNDRIAGGQRINKAVVVVAIGSGHRQAINHQFDAVAIEVGGIQIGAPAGEKGGIAGGAGGGPYARHIAQHVSDTDHVALIERLRVKQSHRAGGQGLLALEFDWGFRGGIFRGALYGHRRQHIGLVLCRDGIHGDQQTQAGKQRLAR